MVDGPFTEAKELIGGWALMEVRDKDEAIEWTKRFLAIAGDGESDHPPGLLPSAARPPASSRRPGRR